MLEAVIQSTPKDWQVARDNALRSAPHFKGCCKIERGRFPGPAITSQTLIIFEPGTSTITLFGRIGIGGSEYGADTITFPDHIQERWWRRQAHRLAQEALETAIAETPRLLLIATGYYGRMQVPEETLTRLQADGQIQLRQFPV